MDKKEYEKELAEAFERISNANFDEPEGDSFCTIETAIKAAESIIMTEELDKLF